MTPPAAFHRPTMIERLEREEFDVLVVGAGVTGAGVALDAASRGLKVALVEKDDFASGTSSKSSKMVHGGLRYLQQGEVRLVYEALRERQRLFKNAPHLVTVLPFMLPVLTKDGVVPRSVARALGSAMWMYDLTGGWRIGKLHRRLRKNAAFSHLPTMHRERLASAYLYFDAAVDDARLVLTLCRSAAQHGAVVVNRCPVTAITKGIDGRANGAVVRVDARDVTVRAKVVVNAAGVWSDDVRALDDGTHPDSIRPAKGVHITVPWEKIRCDIAVVIPVPKDKRSLFLVPWGERPDGTFEFAYVGTTDTDYQGPLDDPQCTKDDIDYVLRAVNAALTTSVTADDIIGVWAGLRPLVKAASTGRTADLSRRHNLHESTSGVLTITGGKLTTYREMAEHTVDAAVRRLGVKARCRTKTLKLLGAGRRSKPDGSQQSNLLHRYGTLASEVTALTAANPSLAEPLIPGMAHVRAEAVYAVRHEMALTLDDVLTRRTRARLFDRPATMAAAPAVAALLAGELGWDAAETQRQVAEFLAFCDEEVVAGRTASPSAAGAAS